jgi:hypothetical protein
VYSVYNLQPLCPLSQAWLDGSCLPLDDMTVQSLAHAHVGSSPILGGHVAHIPYSIPVFITYNLYAPCHKRSLMARAFLFLSD